MREPAVNQQISNASSAEAGERTSVCLCEAQAMYASCYAGGFIDITFASSSLIDFVRELVHEGFEIGARQRQKSLVREGRSLLGLEGK